MGRQFRLELLDELLGVLGDPVAHLPLKLVQLAVRPFELPKASV
jgi:hypothetical protein